MSESVEPHQLTKSQFIEEVHSFEFWFQAVEGYLHDHPEGYSPDLVDVAMSDGEKDRLITALCNYCVGETAALEASGGMITFAPDRHAKIFLSTQVVDEGRHLEVFLRRLASLGVEDPELEIARRANHSLVEFKNRLLEFVDRRDWEAAVFAQNVILESLEFTVFRAHAEQADPITREILLGVVKDERRHIGFGENDLGRRLPFSGTTKNRLERVKKELDKLVLQTFSETLNDLEEGAMSKEELANGYLNATARLGFE